MEKFVEKLIEYYYKTYPFIEKYNIVEILGAIILGLMVNFIYDWLKSKDGNNKINQRLDEIKLLIKQKTPEDEEEVLRKYVGEDYKTVLANPQIYHNLKDQLLKKDKTIQDLLKDKDELSREIKSEKLNKITQKKVDKAFNELRFDDVMYNLGNKDKIINLIKENSDITGQEISMILNINRATVHRYLKMLMEKNVIVCKTKNIKNGKISRSYNCYTIR